MSKKRSKKLYNSLSFPPQDNGQTCDVQRVRPGQVRPRRQQPHHQAGGEKPRYSVLWTIGSVGDARPYFWVKGKPLIRKIHIRGGGSTPLFVTCLSFQIQFCPIFYNLLFSMKPTFIFLQQKLLFKEKNTGYDPPPSC